MIENFENLFNYKCNIMAKILYIKLSKQKDKAKINFLSFYQLFIGLFDEVKDKRNRTIFEILDARSEGELSIIYLM